jgi:hypothetical protein
LKRIPKLRQLSIATDEPLPFLPRLKSLSLVSPTLASLTTLETFTQLKDLQLIQVQNQRSRDVNWDCLSKLTLLSRLKITSQTISTQLITLDFPRLRALDISGSPNFNIYLSKLTNLEFLALRMLYRNVDYDSLSQLLNLQTLITQTQRTQLPFECLNNLRYLCLYHSYHLKFEYPIPTLEYLYIQGRSIKKEGTISKLLSLKTFVVARNQKVFIPDLAKLTKLEALWLPRQQTWQLEVTKLVNLRELYIPSPINLEPEEVLQLAKSEFEVCVFRRAIFSC